MFDITLTPYRPAGMQEVRLHVAARGRTLVVNGEELDFSFMPPGSELPASAIENPWVDGPVVCRDDGVLALTVSVPIPAGAPQELLFPAPVRTAEGAEVDVVDSVVPAFEPPPEPQPLPVEADAEEADHAD